MSGSLKGFNPEEDGGRKRSDSLDSDAATSSPPSRRLSHGRSHNHSHSRSLSPPPPFHPRRTSRRLLVLISCGVSDRRQAYDQRRLLDILDARDVKYDTVDGMDPERRVM